ncbi:MAG: HEPN domain-containing protein [Dictyoglomus sp.]|uniref:HEPN domain-containing protein n=1 Tax=Dictyoglomus sp. TaxID=28205 RepID=UPI003D14E60C
MKDENIRLNVKEEIERAKEAHKSANILFENGLIKDAISRLYYYTLHMVRALLFTKGFEPKSHEGALRLLSLHFIKEGIFEPEIAHIFSRLMKYREEADYNPFYVFSKEDFLSYKEEAKNWLKR